MCLNYYNPYGYYRYYDYCCYPRHHRHHRHHRHYFFDDYLIDGWRTDLWFVERYNYRDINYPYFLR